MNQTFRSNVIPKSIADWMVSMGQICVRDRPLPPWPTIVLSQENPPAFSHTTKDGDNRYDVEEWLGCYSWKHKQITLWTLGIQRVSLDLQLPYVDLFNCVLIHELGHWFNHQAPVTNGKVWNEDAIARYEKCRRYDEVWAQFFAWLYGQKKDAGVLSAFQKLERTQSKPYHAWRKLVSTETNPGVGPYNLADLRNFGGGSVEGQIAVILESLEWSRGHGKNARFDDNGREEVNMLDYLEGQRLRGPIDVVRGMFPPEEDITNW